MPAPPDRLVGILNGSLAPSDPSQGGGSNTITLIKGTTNTFGFNARDADNSALDLSDAIVRLEVRTNPTDVDPLFFKSSATPSQITLIDASKGTGKVMFLAGDTSGLAVQHYSYRMTVAYPDGSFYVIIPPKPFIVSLGGVTEPPAPAFTNTVMVDQNFGLSDALRYVTPGGSGIGDAQVRVYKKSDYDSRNLSNAVGTTTTNNDGRWAHPILVEPGFTYTVVFQKPNAYGPDHLEITA
jgi:hypothetical protein